MIPDRVEGGKTRPQASSRTICSRYAGEKHCFQWDRFTKSIGEERHSVPATCTKFLCLQVHYWATDHVDLWEQL